VPAAPRGLPTIFLGEASKLERELPPVYLCETSHDGASSRLKWMASTCLAGMVGVCLIGVAIYASMNMSDGSGMMSSIKRASLAALQPIRSARLAQDAQSATGQKEDRIQLTSAGFTSRQVIHDTVVERQGSREFITIKPYLRIVASLGTALPDDVDKLPPFNPFKLYSDATPIGTGNDATDAAAQPLVVNVVDVPGGVLPANDHVELAADQVNHLVAEAAENFAYAEAPLAMNDGDAKLQLASYRPDEVERPRLLPNTTVIQKSAEDDDDDVSDEMIASAETKDYEVDKGDTLMGLFLKAGTDKTLAATILDSIAPVFSADDLKPGQHVQFRVVPVPSDTGQVEPVRVSIFDKDGSHIVSASRDRDGDFVASTQGAPDEAKLQQASNRATLYQAFYHTALEQHIPPATILKLLRVHSYDVDFKQKVHPGDSFEVFFDDADGDGDDEMGELLYTSMTVAGETRKFYRFRTPDDTVDYYDENGDSAKKFLMRNPVKGGRYTSGYGMRMHPLLHRMRMHTGVDWAAPLGTPILAAGDGVVEMAQREGGYGNFVRIRHANGFSTGYGHMLRFAPGMEPGVHVKQGQVIGFVGSTGRSTGPHCHFEVLVNNKFVNPMTIAVPRGLQLAGRELAAFEKERRRIEALMQLDPVTARVAQATPAE